MLFCVIITASSSTITAVSTFSLITPTIPSGSNVDISLVIGIVLIVIAIVILIVVVIIVTVAAVVLKSKTIVLQTTSTASEMSPQPVPDTVYDDNLATVDQLSLYEKIELSSLEDENK